MHRATPLLGTNLTLVFYRPGRFTSPQVFKAYAFVKLNTETKRLPRLSGSGTSTLVLTPHHKFMIVIVPVLSSLH